MRLNPYAPAWTPGPCSSREHGEGGGVTARRVGTHQREEESRAGGPSRGWKKSLDGNIGKHRENICNTPRVRKAIKRKQIKIRGRRRRRRRRGRAKRRLAKKTAHVARQRQQRRRFMVATWNVRTMAVNGANGYGRAFSLLDEVKSHGVSVIGLQETRRKGQSEFTAAGFRVFCSGSKTGGTHGVGIAVRDFLCKNSTFTTEFVDERLMAMRFEMNGHRGAVNFVAAYAPTEGAADGSKRAFWGKLDSLVRGIPTKECVYVLMDANARTGPRMEGEDERVMGEEGRNELNDNGRLLLTFATDNRLAILNTFFPARRGGTWHTCNGVSGNERWRLDYILTRQAHRGRVSNVIVVPQPIRPAKSDSDHNMVVATVNLHGRLAHNRAVRTKSKPPQFSRQALQEEGARWAVRERFAHMFDQHPGGPTIPTAELATVFTTALLDAARTVLPKEPRRRRTQEWCETPETRAALEEAMAKRRGARRAFERSRTAATWRALKAACRAVQTAVDTGIYAHLERYVSELEAIYADRDMRGMYKHLKRSVGLSGRQAGGQPFIQDENGVLLRNKQHILQRWASFFGILLNTKSLALNPDIAEQTIQRQATPASRRLGKAPTLEEVEWAVEGLMNWKAPGHDSLPAELLKIDDDEPVVLERLHAILVDVWNGREIPREWKDATIKVLYKKGDRSNCNNFRGILLLSHVGKVSLKIITNRLSAYCEANDNLPEAQCGFRPGRSTVCMLFVMRRLQELAWRRKLPLRVC